MTYLSIRTRLSTKNGIKKSSNSRVYFLALIVTLPTILSGLETCFSSIALPQMNLTVYQASWYVAGPSLIAAIGTLILGSILDAFGRKVTFMLSTLSNAVGWTIISCGENFMISLIGRMLTGLTVTFTCYTAQVYIVECLTVNDKYLRDSLRIWPNIGFAFGQLVTFLLGAVTTHLQFSAFTAIFSSILFLLIFFFVVESPGWLYQKGRIGDAEVASQKLRIKQPILQPLVHGQEIKLPLRDSLHNMDLNVSVILERIKQEDIYKPAVFMTVMCTLALLTGGMALSSYMINIIDGSQPGIVNTTTTQLSTPGLGNFISSDVNLLTFKYGIISGILMVLGTVLLSFVMPYTGARKLTIGSAIFMCIGMSLIGFSNDQSNPSDFLTVRLFSVWLVSFIFSFGIITIPCSIMSAMFPPDAKGFASLAIMVQILATFAVSATYPYLYLLSKSGVFYGYGIMCLLYAFFVYIVIPETVGRSYEQIRADF